MPGQGFLEPQPSRWKHTHTEVLPEPKSTTVSFWEQIFSSCLWRAEVSFRLASFYSGLSPLIKYVKTRSFQQKKYKHRLIKEATGLLLYMLLVKGHSLAAWENISLKYPMQVECWAAYGYWLLLSRNCFATNYYGKAALATTKSSDISESSALPVQLQLQVHHGILMGPPAPFIRSLLAKHQGQVFYHLPSALDQRLPHSVFHFHSVFPFCFCLSQTKEISRNLLWKAEGSQALQFQHNQPPDLHLHSVLPDQTKLQQKTIFKSEKPSCER